VKVSNSQLSAYKDCPQKWEYSYVHSYKPLARRRTFDKGNYTHELMHVLYQLMQDSHHEPGSDFLQAAIHQRIMGDLENAAKDNLAVYASIIKVMTSYVQYRSPLIDRQIKIEGVEATLEVEAQTPKGHTVFCWLSLTLFIGIYVVEWLFVTIRQVRKLIPGIRKR
jgi:hypothetical protein